MQVYVFINTEFPGVEMHIMAHSAEIAVEKLHESIPDDICNMFLLIQRIDVIDGQPVRSDLYNWEGNI